MYYSPCHRGTGCHERASNTSSRTWVVRLHPPGSQATARTREDPHPQASYLGDGTSTTSSVRAWLDLTVAVVGSGSRTQPPDSGAPLSSRGQEPAATEPPPDSSTTFETEAPAARVAPPRNRALGAEHTMQKHNWGGGSHMHLQVRLPVLKHSVGTLLRLWAQPCLSQHVSLGGLAD
jgi:hypothetical protein